MSLAVAQDLAGFRERLRMHLGRWSKGEIFANAKQILQIWNQSRALKWIALLAQTSLGLILLWQITLWSNVDGVRLVQRFTQASPLPLASGVAFFVGAMLLGALRYWFFFSPSISIRYLFSAALLQNFLLTFVPWRIGEVGYPVLLRHDFGTPLARSSVVILGIRLTDLLILLVVALAGGTKLGLAAYRDDVVYIIVGGVLVTIAAGVWWRDSALKLGSTLLSALHPIKTPNRLVSFILISILIFVFTTLQSAFILKSVGLDITPFDVAILNATTLLVALLPVHPPGGWGTIDSVQLMILGRLSFDPAVAAPVILAAHSIYTLLIVAGGILGWRLRKSQVGSRAGV